MPNETTASIVIAGPWKWDIYEEGLASGFRSLGWHVIPFKFGTYFPNSPLYRVQIKAKCGPVVRKLNNDLINIVSQKSPTAVFLFKADVVFSKTVRRIRSVSKKTVVLSYHNDNPFIGLRNRLKWRHYLKSLKDVDVAFVYRPSNVKDALRCGARRTSILMPHYLSWRHFPMNESIDEYAQGCDVVFVGHYESDGRDQVIDYLVRNGISVCVYGTRWEKVAKKYAWASDGKIKPAYGIQYTRLISRAKIALVFLSQLNSDVWTRRCFEIPACGTFMVAPRTRELESLFRDGVEAVFYDDKEDLLEIVRYYLSHPEEREWVASNGRRRCVVSMHNEVGRARQIIRMIQDVQEVH